MSNVITSEQLPVVQGPDEAIWHIERNDGATLSLRLNLLARTWSGEITEWSEEAQDWKAVATLDHKQARELAKQHDVVMVAR